MILCNYTSLCAYYALFILYQYAQSGSGTCAPPVTFFYTLLPTGKIGFPHWHGLPLPISPKNKKTPMMGIILSIFDIALSKIVYYGQKTKGNRGEIEMGSSDTGTVKRGRGRPKGSKDKKKRGYTVSEKAIAQRKDVGIKKRMPAETPEEFDYNARLITHVMRINEIATHANRSDLNTLKECFIAYLQLCQEDGFPTGNLAAYSAMGFYARNSFDHFINRDDPDIRAFGTFVKATCAMMREGIIADGKINPVIGIFWQMNFDGLRNDTEQVQAIRDMEEESTGSSAYKDKYKNLIGE